MTWLAHAGPVGLGHGPAGAWGSTAGWPGGASRSRERRINAVLCAARAMVVHAVAAGQASGHLVPLLYEIAGSRDLPAAAQGERAGMSWRMRVLHRLYEPDR